ncbi:MAG: CBS domain-containing protein [Bacteroidia bacterium]|nr:CBS domain-containing protein [Bacteroidia bacterium]
MFANQFLSNEIFPLKKSDSVASAEVFMQDFKVKELPVVELGKILGYVSESILELTAENKVEACMDINIDAFLVKEFTHYFELWQRFEHSKSDSLFVVNSENMFVGIITAKDLIKQTYSKLSLAQEGSFLVIEIPAIQYSPAELARICESNDAKILHLMVAPKGTDANLLHVSIKLNKLYLNHVMASLDRFGYHVIHTNSPLDPNQNMDDRFQWLLKYLNT